MSWKIPGVRHATRPARPEAKAPQGEKDLRGLSRKDLLEILVEQGRRIDELTEEVARLKQPARRELTTEEVNLLVEAARRINRAYPVTDTFPIASGGDAPIRPRHSREGL